MTKRILVVEDESLLALDIADQIRDAGFEVVGPATSVAKAQELLREVGCDAAVLDVNLCLETVEPVAIALQARGVPFLFLSGNSREQLSPGLQSALWLSKPVLPAVLLAALHKSVRA
jgi:DNA-binding response OmpR family regulator